MASTVSARRVMKTSEKGGPFAFLTSAFRQDSFIKLWFVGFFHAATRERHGAATDPGQGSAGDYSSSASGQIL
jgi:hypothetical protein